MYYFSQPSGLLHLRYEIAYGIVVTEAPLFTGLVLKGQALFLCPTEAHEVDTGQGFLSAAAPPQRLLSYDPGPGFPEMGSVGLRGL